MRIRKNDMVKVIAGKDRGKTGKVLSVIEGGKRVVVEGINIVKRHSRPDAQNRTGGIVEKPAPLAISNVMLLAPQDQQPTRVSYRFEEADGTRRKVRYSRKLDRVLD